MKKKQSLGVLIWKRVKLCLVEFGGKEVKKKSWISKKLVYVYDELVVFER